MYTKKFFYGTFGIFKTITIWGLWDYSRGNEIKEKE